MARRTSSAPQREEFLAILRERFENNMQRHEGISWETVAARLIAHPQKLKALREMERTGGEPDVVTLEKKTGKHLFVDCSPESPAGRRSLCYDRAARVARKEHPPKSSVMELAEEMGVEVLTEGLYRELQQFGVFDLKTSSWVRTPHEIRKLGGALFCDRRYDTVFLYHNGADSYYAARGFRAVVRV